MDKQLTGDRRQLSQGQVPDCGNSTVLGYMAKKITDLHSSYSTTVESILRSPKYSNKPNITALSESLNQHFDNCQGLIARLTQQLKEEHKIILKTFDDAVKEIAEEDCW
ncbi:hypothetical protein CC86DRAFT_403295 [Ophiobolus disseminans]|uniref:Uncharacterized protein n=1 Tax=Ophiobolus disseminans TaxID=1469910 RepID=A0A6A7AAS6_9PLEO|nr:hypothetical protein CC86DRAFT_403295 [Ophiobolus disseminans]